ncbi:MAG: class I SAM-dependent DNA methyltransferase [Chloroflexi bacterium]|nr:class I SAM-dependent DNA methyltransferase [Chloroflexota bacterium]MQC25623.1 class I SAM-dependent DNA methyltransferase [Chloroflexota bacterium]MQC47718.1 class I SAM-dependent DNA methyltransferase [Chloroflexota bacterium]
MTADEFVAKWRANAGRESQVAQTHFNDLCAMLGVLTPSEADPSNDWYCFEKRVTKLDGSTGFADVWRRGFFGWENKGRGSDLDAAYRQLLDYREDLENPPLLVVSDIERIIIRTNFTGSRPVIYEVTLQQLADPEQRAEALRILRAAMTDPDALRPQQTPEQVTTAAAQRFAAIARSLTERGHEPEAVAHFLNRILFCLFAEDVGLLPARIMTGLVESRASRPEEFCEGLSGLFALMSSREGSRFFGNERIEWFNGGLFDDSTVLDLSREELTQVREACRLDWSQVEPSILGTLFERGLDPAKRGQLGAHYTDAEKIEMVVEPVVMQPLRREFEAMRARVEELMAGRRPSPLTRYNRRQARLPTWERDAETTWRGFLDRLEAVRVLDPACGSGNFLYVTLRKLKDLEQQAIRWGSERLGITGFQPRVGPHNLLGIELNPYAKELAGVSIWVGHIQWMIENGYGFPRDPVLQPLDNIELRDAILARDAEGRPIPATWPDAEFVVGNPPFLGSKMMRLSLGDEAVDAIFAAWDGIVARESDLVCYWHEMARQQIERGTTRRAGLLSTNSIRGGANRRTLDRIRESGALFAAWSDEPWVVDGAAVRVSIVAQDDGSEQERTLDGESVTEIYADLTGSRGTSVDIASAARLAENMDVSFMGDTKVGPFDIPGDLARQMLAAPSNVNGHHNADVVVPWVNGLDMTRRPRDMFIIDFGTSMSEAEAASYEITFEYVSEHVRPMRANARSGDRTGVAWWRHQRPRPDMRGALAPLRRFLGTARVAKYRLWAWVENPVLPDNQIIVVAREDNYAFGVLHSRAHELWSLRMGTSLEDRPRYTPTSTFETFPFPWPLNTPDDALTAEQREHRDAIGAAAAALDADRRHWLNPPEWVREEPDVLPSLPPPLRPQTPNSPASPRWRAGLLRLLHALGGGRTDVTG